MAETKKGRQYLTEKDFVDVVDADGDPLPAVPKHWTEDDLPAGARFAKKGKKSGGSSGSSSGGSQRQEGEEPAGNAKTEEWVAFAREKGATDADLVDADGKDLTRDQLREKYGSAES